MKHLLLTAALLLPLGVAAQAITPTAQDASQPFKKANVVVITTSDSLDTAYKKVAQAILEAGYTIDRADKELNFINTKARPLARMGLQESIQASLKPIAGGVAIFLSGTWASPSMAAISPLMAGDSKVEYRGMKGSAIMGSWEELQRVAKLYAGGTLTYRLQP